MSEECRMTQETKALIDDVIKYAVEKGAIKGSDILASSDMASFELLGFISRGCDLTFKMIDDAYAQIDEQRKVNEKLLDEIKELNGKLYNQNMMIESIMEKLLDEKKDDKKKKSKFDYPDEINIEN